MSIYSEIERIVREVDSQETDLAGVESQLVEALTLLDGKASGGGGDDFDAFIDGTLTNVNSGATKIASYTFYGNTTLESVNFLAATSIASYAFYGCTALQRATFAEATSISTYGFRNCEALKRVDFSNLQNIGNNVFLGSSVLTTVIIRTSAVCKLANKNSFTDTPIASGTGFIYVPDSLIDSYKSASNWSIFATQFRALEDYTVDGTTTGELDESKI